MQNFVAKQIGVLAIMGALVLSACHRDEGPELGLGAFGATEEEAQARAQGRLQASPTNAVADDPMAAQMGQALFFDRQMSADGRVSCASCHSPANGFADPRPLSLGVEGREGTRHAPTLVNASMQEFFFWGGRADSLWSAPMQAIEAELEADFTRTEVAHHVAARYRAPYEELFGPLPDLSALPQRAKPGDAAWDAMSDQEQEAVNRIFSNVGKVLEAYQRRFTCDDTRFDRVMAGLEDFTAQERRGARQFTDPNGGNCVACHGGFNFSDGRFHNLQIPGSPDDLGRFDGIPSLLENPFNGAGEFSDDTGEGQEKLEGLAQNNRQIGAFKTPTLRGVTQRAPYGHLGHINDLEQWLVQVYLRPRPSDAPGQRDPAARGLRFNAGDVAAFLRTLECPELPAELVRPIGPDGQPLPPPGAGAPPAGQGPAPQGTPEEGEPPMEDPQDDGQQPPPGGDGQEPPPGGGQQPPPGGGQEPPPGGQQPPPPPGGRG